MKTTVPMNLMNGNLHLDISLWNLTKNKYSIMNILFDTGASVTTISKNIINDLGYDLTECEKVIITTASGIAYVDIVTLKSIKINDIELKNVKVYAHTFPEESFSLGVIGMNIIDKFDIEMLFSKRLINFTSIE